jgi:alpha-glucosidase
MRHVSRWGALVADHDAFAKQYASLLMTLRGSVCLYQGEELALTEADLAYQDLQDPYGIQFWPEFKGRDGCRTPMVWDSQVAQGGFSTVTPWLPVPVEHILRAVSVQQGDENSVLEHYRRFLAFRKLYPAFAKGEIEFSESQEDALIFTREYGNEKILCVFNMSALETNVSLPAGEWQALTGHGFNSNNYGDKIDIPAWGAYFARLA